jgi:hypothetical protein
MDYIERRNFTASELLAYARRSSAKTEIAHHYRTYMNYAESYGLGINTKPDSTGAFMLVMQVNFPEDNTLPILKVNQTKDHWRKENKRKGISQSRIRKNNRRKG